MILTVAVLSGLLAGLGRAGLSKRPLNLPQFQFVWLAVLAFIPQLLLFRLPLTRELFSDSFTAVGLVVSQLMLLAFAWQNRHLPGFGLLGIGLGLNLLVIIANGGFMPIAPAVVEALIPNAPEGYWTTGQRLGIGKDIVLPVEATRLWSLSDRFLLPAWFPYRVAYSLGDVFIFLGAFWSLWMIGGPQKEGDNYLITLQPQSDE